MSDFKGKVVIVTGASSGIGAGIAVLFAQRGASLVLCGRNVQKLEETAKHCASFGNCPAPLTIAADQKDEAAVKDIVHKTIKHYGRLNVLVNNAGMAHFGGLQNIDMNHYDEIMQTNLRSVVVLTHEAVPFLSASKGSVVNISSVAGIKPFLGALAYSMSKAALDQFTKCVALELAPHGVRVFSVNPAAIDTNFVTRAGMSESTYQTYLEKSKSLHALGRYGTVEDVAEVVVFLASDGASFMTGTVVPVDGGSLLLSKV